MGKVRIGALIALCAAAPAAQAHTHRHSDHPRTHRTATFAGSCELTGTVLFTPPLAAAPRPTTDYAQETGTCSGTLTAAGRSTQVSGAPVRYFATDTGQAGSCAGSVDAVGWGDLAFPRAVIFFRLAETRVSGAAQLSLTGDSGGAAQGAAAISSTANPIQIAEDCAGSGLRSAPVDISLETTPAISG
jgi:hypothetical protein